jgi:hypothetical protein
MISQDRELDNGKTAQSYEIYRVFARFELKINIWPAAGKKYPFRLAFSGKNRSTKQFGRLGWD